MPRANRHYIPGYVWHITHRCHKKEFLLRFARDRRRYLQWLFEARERYALIDYERLRGLLNFSSIKDLGAAYRGWVDGSLSKGIPSRDARWTESVAVGSEGFVTATKEKLGTKAKGREVIGGNGSYELRERQAAYKGILGHENDVLRFQNEYFWEDSFGIST